MKHFSLLSAMLFVSLFTVGILSCSKDTEVLVDTALPQGAFSATRSGNIIEQNATGSKGVVQIGKDSKGIDFLKFGSDFTTVLATGTVSVYMSTSSTFKADPGKGNPDIKLVGFVKSNGEMFIKLASSVESKFTHLILWCGSANVPFGNAELK